MSTQNIYSVADIATMKTYAGKANRIHVTATNEDYVTCSSCTADEVTIYAGAGGKKWKKVSDATKGPKTYTSVKDFGAKGDGVTDDRAAIQAGVDALSAAGGGTLFFPGVDIATGKYYRVSLPVYWASKVNMLGEGQLSLIKNDSASSNSVERVPIYYGNYQPKSYNDDQQRYYATGAIAGNSVTLASSADLSHFTAGQIVIIRSNTGWFNSDGSYKPYVGRINRVSSVVAPATILLEDNIDVTLADGKIGVQGQFLSNATKGDDGIGHACYFMSDVNITNMSFESTGQWINRLSLYKANWNNIWAYGAEGISGNALAWQTWNNIKCTFWKQFSESSMFSHDSIIQNVTAKWINNSYLVDTGDPLWRFGENAHKITFKNITVDIATANRKFIWMNDATDCTIDNVTLMAQSFTKELIEISNGKAESIVSGNTVKNSKFDINNSKYYVLFDKSGFAAATLLNNRVENNQFLGTIGQKSVVLDGTNSLVKNNYFKAGDMSIGANVSNCMVDGNYMNNPSQVLTGVTFTNNRNTY